MQKDLKNIIFTGIDMHLGSQITEVEPFIEASERLIEIFLKLKADGINLKHIDVGGGIGTAYNNEKTFSIKEYADALISLFKKLDCEVFLEPGRFFTANSGILAAQVLYTKKTSRKNFIITDGAMNDLLRPSIYGAYHHVQPLVAADGKPDIKADVVGPVCESGDFLAKNITISECKRTDYIAVMSAGAYGMVMSSNYNMRRRPPEILVDGNNYKLIRSRETFEHIIYDEENLL
jgi:diaminopimelate decarboxylase